MKYYLKAMEKEIIIGNDLPEINHITHFIQEMGNSLQIQPSTIMSINLALEEAIANVIQYAYPNGGQHEIRLKINISPQELIFTLIDDGVSFNPILSEENVNSSVLEQCFIDSLGIFLIHKIMDEVFYQSDKGINQLTMKKNLDTRIETEKTMKINICKIEGIAIVTLEGRLDTVNAQEFESNMALLMEDLNPNIIINCENFSYISSSGIRSLISLQKNVLKNKGKLILEAMKPEIRKIFDMTGCSAIFTIH